MTQININNQPDSIELNCTACTFKQDYCNRVKRNLRAQQCERFRCVCPTDHGGVFVKETGALMVRFTFAPDEMGRTAKLMEEYALAEDFVFNLLNPHHV